jgi:hypothetical protein
VRRNPVVFVALTLFAFGCSGSSSNSDDDSGMTDDASMSADSSDGGNDSGMNDTGMMGDDTSETPDTGSVDNSDGFGAARAACIAEINKLRATESRPAYVLNDTPAIDTCVDEQATYDQMNNSAHDAWLNMVYPTCNGNGQDECLGYGTSPAEVVACLDAMWNERTQSNCSSCGSCTTATTLNQSVLDCEDTTTCDFYGHYGAECGHYCNMSADYFTEVACGFSTAGTTKDWAVQNFFQ